MAGQLGQRVQVNWQESAEELKMRYRREHHTQRRTRLHALWQLRLGQQQEVVAVDRRRQPERAKIFDKR